MRRSSLAETDDVELIACAARGDREAFGCLYERYVPRVFRHIYALTSDPQVAEDLTGHTFLKALEAIPRYEPRGVPFLAWLLRIAHNLTINHLKNQRLNGHAPLTDSATALPDSLGTAAAKLDAGGVWELVRRLRKEQRQVIVMRYIDGLGYQDIARVLGKSVGAVRVIQYRALLSLRRLLQEERTRHRSARAPLPGQEGDAPPI